MNDTGTPLAALAAELELVVTSGPSVGVTIPLNKRNLAFGAAAGNDVHMKDPSVRPQHARLEIAETGALWFHDLTDANETFVNGSPITSCQLESGARIRIGVVELWLRPRQGTGARAPAVGQAPHQSGPQPAGRPKSGPSDTVMRPSGAQPKAPTGAGAISGARPRASGASPAAKPGTGPNDTMLRPSGLQRQAAPTSGSRTRYQSGPNQTLMRPSGTHPASEEGYAEDGPNGVEDTDPGASMLAPDEVIGGRYRIVAKLAAGGMGEVYKAEHVELGKLFALKVMRREMSNDPEFAERFKREAITASRIGQQNIVDISDFGRTEKGLFYFVMEFLVGETLADLLKQEHVLSVARALPITLQVCRALAAAHKQGIIHRDLKPENVMLLQRPEQADFAKVLDFGVAKVADGHGKGGQTALGIVLGTPQYMSPEQASGLMVDARSDIYSLGLMLYEMVCGRPVFQEATPSLLMAAHINRPPPPMLPGPVAPLPEGLESLVMRTLAKSAADRPRSMDDVSAVLENCLIASRGRISGPWPAVASGAGQVSGGLPASTQGVAAMPAASSAAVSTGANPVPDFKSRTPTYVLIGLVGAGLVGGGLFFGLRPPPTQVLPQPRIEAKPAPDPVLAPPPMAAPAGPGNPGDPELVKLTVHCKPERVEVYDGDVLLGTTPADIPWEKGKRGQLRFVAEGYLTDTRVVQPRGDITLDISLKPRAVAKPKKAGSGASGDDSDDDLKDDPYR